MTIERYRVDEVGSMMGKTVKQTFHFKTEKEARAVVRRDALWCDSIKLIDTQTGIVLVS